jgi:transposase
MDGMRKLYLVRLTPAERQTLRSLLRAGTAQARRLTRARILLLSDGGKTDAQIAEALCIGRATVERTRKKYAQEGLEMALQEKPRPGAKPKLAERQQAYLVALACSEPPPGRTRWTLELLARELVRRGVVDSISKEPVRLVLKKTRSSPGRSGSGASRGSPQSF